MSRSATTVSPHSSMQAQFQSYLSQMLNPNLTIPAFNSLMQMLPPNNLSQAKGYLRAILDGTKQTSSAAVLLIQALGKILAWLPKSLPDTEFNEYITKIWDKFKDYPDPAVRKILVMKVSDLFLSPKSANQGAVLPPIPVVSNHDP